MNIMVSSTQRLARLLATLFATCLIALFVIMLGAVLVQIVGRYVFNYSIASASEIATYCQIWLVLLGSGLAMSRNQHVAIDFLPAKLPLVPARIAMVLVGVIILGFLTALSYAALPLMQMGMIQTSPALKMPMWIMYLSIPMGAFYISLSLITNICQRWNTPFSQSPETVEESQ